MTLLWYRVINYVILELFKLNTKKTNKNKPIKGEKDRYYYKYFPVSTREWNNSIYKFNKTTLGLLPQAAIFTIKLIKGYLKIHNWFTEKKIRTNRLLRRHRKFSSNKIYVNNGEFKHTNDKVIITLYTYNRQKHNYLSILKKRYLSLQKRNKKLNKRLYLIKYKGFKCLQKIQKDNYNRLKKVNIFNITKNKKIMESYFKFNSIYRDQLVKFYKKLVKKSLQRIKFYLYYKQLLYINQSIFKYTYLQILKTYIETVYNKRVEFNLINLKYHYLNCEILSKSITLKITRKRRKLSKYLKRLIRKIKVQKLDRSPYDKPNLNKLNISTGTGTYDPIENLFNTKSRPGLKSLKRVVLDEIKYRRLSGVILKASGRLTKRNVASRSIAKLKGTGSLINTDSTYKGLSTVLLKGNLKSNIQYTKSKSKTRIGSFGIKSWVSGD